VLPSVALNDDPAATSVRSCSMKKRDGHKKGGGSVWTPVLAALISLQRIPRSHPPNALLSRFRWTLARSEGRRRCLFCLF
jgi:hypothetical protein